MVTFMNTQKLRKQALNNVLSFLILFFLLASVASGEDYVIQLKSLAVLKVSEERFQIRGEIVNHTDTELKRIAIKFKVYDPTGKVIEENQVLPFVNPIPPHGSSPFLTPIKYSPGMEKVTIHFITLVGKELSVDPRGYPLEIRVPK